MTAISSTTASAIRAATAEKASPGANFATFQPQSVSGAFERCQVVKGHLEGVRASIQFNPKSPDRVFAVYERGGGLAFSLSAKQAKDLGSQLMAYMQELLEKGSNIPARLPNIIELVQQAARLTQIKDVITAAEAPVGDQGKVWSGEEVTQMLAAGADSAGRVGRLETGLIEAAYLRADEAGRVTQETINGFDLAEESGKYNPHLTARELKKGEEMLAGKTPTVPETPFQVSTGASDFTAE